MKILVFGDLIGKTYVVKQLFRLKLKSFDYLIYTGDTPDPSVFKALRETRVSKGINKNTDIEKELIEDTITHMALKKATREVVSVCSLLDKISVPLYGVLGNADLQYYSQFVKWPFVLLHNKIKRVGRYNLIGYNGRPLYQFEKENKNENAFPESRVEEDLEKIFAKVDPRKSILITHSPAFEILDQVEEEMRDYAVNTYGSSAKNGHIGSKGIRKIVEKYKPLIHIFSHVHESKGVIRNNTTFINIGSTGENKEVCEIFIVNSTIKTSFLSILN